MRASRAYITSLGTTSVLIASSLLLLAVVSTFVAFRSWPGDDIVTGLEGLLVDQNQPSLELTGPAQVASDAAPAAAAVAADPPPGTPLLAATAGSPPAEIAPTGTTLGTIEAQPPIVLPDPGSNPGPGGGGPNGGSTTPQAPVGSPGTSLPAPPQGTRELTSRLGDTTQALTQGLGQTLNVLNPPLGSTVTDTGEALSELVRGLGSRR